MLRRVPVLPTLIVLAAVAIMLRLGFWQLERKSEKEALLAGYERTRAMSADAAWPRDEAAAELVYYRHARIRCDLVRSITPMAGINARGESGIAHVAVCDLDGGGSANVVLGWSRDPGQRQWGGGEIGGIIAPGGDAGTRLIASPPVAGLEANARPDPSGVPNNHLSYAVQWFLFAGVALVIYGLAVRKRMQP